ncbi:MAG: fatty acyl-AMP ligase [Myxococcales bacterium]|nr:fatty acyl-AMP ligase [Myxococcales bacterium]
MPHRIPSAERACSKSRLLDKLDQHWVQFADKTAFRFLAYNGEEAETLSYQSLSQRVFALAHALVEDGRRGKPVILLFPDGLDFVVGILATLYAGAIAVPLPRPHDRAAAQRIAACASNCEARVILTSHNAIPVLRAGLVQAGLEPSFGDGFRWMSEQDAAGYPTAWPPAIDLSDDTVGLLQYTSGSTGEPKGVVITHGNLAANGKVIQAAFQHDSSLVGVGWLPLSHDMGLMGHVFQPLLVGGESNLMSPLTLIRNPRRWLEAISKYRARTSGGPCFAFELACRRISEQDLQGLDLRCWRLAYCGAEPIRADSLERFAAQFAAAGFSAQALYPCYGLAESTLFVTGVAYQGGITAEQICGDALTESVIKRTPNEERTRTVVSCGLPAADHQVAIVHPERRTRCEADELGEIWVRGPSVASGYWNRTEESAATFQATLADDPEQTRYLRTGDLGYRSAQGVFVAGRLKDILIIHGKNRHAEDIEAAARMADASLFARRSAAFSTWLSGAEAAVLVQEVSGPLAEETSRLLARQIQASLLKLHGFVADEILFVPSGAIPRTTSGKVRRRDCRRLYERRELPVLSNVRASAST